MRATQHAHRTASYRAAIATVASAVLYGLAFRPEGTRHLAWIAMVPFLVAVPHASPRAALLLGWTWGLVSAYVVGDWFPRAVATYWDQPYAVGFGLFLVVSTATAGTQYALFALAHRRIARWPCEAMPIVVGAAWVAAELGRARLFGGNPWALAGLSQAGVVPLMQIADVTGVYGVSFAIAATNAAVAQWWQRRDARATRGLAVAGLVVTMVLAYGATRLPRFATDEARGHLVAVVQGALPVSGSWSPEHYGRNLDVYLRLTETAIGTTPPALVVWPESALTFFLEEEPPYRAAIAAALSPRGVELLTGGPRSVGAHSRFFNSAFLLDATATPRAVYDKRLLLPFGEYFPLGTEVLTRRSFGAVRQFVPGAPAAPLPTPAGSAGVLVCNEAMYPELAAERVREGAEYLVVLSNDSWVGEPTFSAIAAAMATFRAVETRRDLVRSSTWGPSGIVTAAGRTLALAPPGAATAVAGRVTPRAALSPYARMGDAFAWLCLAVALAAVVRGEHPGEQAPARPAG